jgi:putative restriction endonuclease
MSKLKKLSNTSWQQPFKNRKKELHLFTTHKDVSEYCNLQVVELVL